MAFIRFSNSYMSDVLNLMFGSTSQSASLNNSNATVSLMQGTIPTYNEISEATNRTLGAFRTSDILVKWEKSNGDFNFASTTTSAGDPAFVINTEVVLATTTGTATWLMFDSGLNNTNGFSIIVGTVTTPGGGGDFEITDTTILTGKTYKISNVIFTVPVNFTW